VVLAGAGRIVAVAGQVGVEEDGNGSPPGIAEQFEKAIGRVVRALSSAGASPESVVSMMIFVTDIQAYQAALEPIGSAYRRHFGRHYPAVTLVEVRRLFAKDALVEITVTAVMADNHAG
jgi:enamine deaminase RidA (YjgF/YER057c/UK114 family)